jgi:hypothetical protein
MAVGVGEMALVMAVACGTSSKSSSTTQMRVVPLSPDSPALDLVIDNKVVFGGMTYGVPTAFSTVTAINHDLKLNVTSTSQNLIDHTAETFAAGTSYTYLVTGFFSASTGGVQTSRLIDDHTVADKGNFKLRVVNGSPNSGPVDVYIVTPGTKFKDANPPIAPTLTLASDTASAYQSLASGGYDIYVTPGGDQTCLTDPKSTTVPPPPPPLPPSCFVNLDGRNGTAVPSFQAGQNRTLIMLNQVGGLGVYTTLPMLADLN